MSSLAVPLPLSSQVPLPTSAGPFCRPWTRETFDFAPSACEGGSPDLTSIPPPRSTSGRGDKLGCQHTTATFHGHFLQRINIIRVSPECRSESAAKYPISPAMSLVRFLAAAQPNPHRPIYAIMHDTSSFLSSSACCSITLATQRKPALVAPFRTSGNRAFGSFAAVQRTQPPRTLPQVLPYITCHVCFR